MHLLQCIMRAESSMSCGYSSAVDGHPFDAACTLLRLCSHPWDWLVFALQLQTASVT